MEIDKRFDAEFKKVKGLNTNWLPWIGKDYYESPEKLLIVGESVYLTDEIDVTQDDYIRELINKDGMHQGWYETNKFIGERHKKLERILSLNPEDEKSKRIFWQKSAYYNLIQMPLESREGKDRPHYQLFLNGWDTFFQLINIIQPHYCLLNGVGSFNHFYDRYANNFELSVIEKTKLEKIDDTYPRKIILKNHSTGIITILVFIKHTSHGMNWKNWENLVIREFKL